MEDFISLGHEKQKTEEFDVLKLTTEPDSPPPVSQTDPRPVQHKRSIATVKPFYPRCKRVLTRAPFVQAATNPLPSNDTRSVEEPASSAAAVQPASSAAAVQPASSAAAVQPAENAAAATTSSTVQPPPHSQSKPSSSSVAHISLEELMSVEEKKLPERKRPVVVVESDERIVRLRNMLKQAEAEKVTLQGYVANLQAKLAAVPKKLATKCSESQTDENGVKCPTCNGHVEPHVLLKTFGDDFIYDTNAKQFVQKSSGFFYNPYTQLYHCQDNNVLYYWDTLNSIYHYHSKVPAPDSPAPDRASSSCDGSEEEEEEGELTDEQTVTEELKDAANNAMKESGVEFITSMNMYFNKNTGLYYCQSSGLYYDTKMSVFYTITDGKHVYHSSAKPDDIKSAYAKTCIRAIVKESTCHKVKAGVLYVFTCMGGTIGREGNHVAVFPEIRVSKRHATISYCSGKYYITDEGTMNGTFLNNTRLSVQKGVSERFELSHLDELKIGSTVLQLHIHTNQDTCNWCEPGLNTTKPVAATISGPPTLYKQRTKEMNRLKRKYKLMGSN